MDCAFTTNGHITKTCLLSLHHLFETTFFCISFKVRTGLIVGGGGGGVRVDVNGEV